MRGACAGLAYLILSALCSFSFAGDPTTIVTTENAPAPAVLPPPLTAPAPFVMNEKLTPRVRFWVDIYAKYHSWETVISDGRYPQLVFAAVDTRNRLGAAPSEKRRLASALSRLADKWPDVERGVSRRSTLRADEMKLLEVFERAGLTKEITVVAADPKRLRGQAGLRDALEDSLFASGRYLPRMKALFNRFHLPEEIAYLPFVESGFNKRAVSKVGASGIWLASSVTSRVLPAFIARRIRSR